MKAIIKIFTMALFVTMLQCGSNAFGQNPPPPPPGGGQGGSGNVPGGGSPIGSGIAMMLLLGAAYAGKKLLQLNQDEQIKNQTK